MSDWFFISYEAAVSIPSPVRDGMTPESGWFRGTNHPPGPSRIDTSLFQPGDTLWILDDHNNKPLDHLAQLGGLSNLTIRGDYPGRPGKIRVFSVGGSSNVTIKGLSIEQGSFGIGSSSDIIIDNVRSDGSGTGKGFFVNTGSPCYNITIRNSEFFNGREGIEIFNKSGISHDGWLIENNKIHDIGYDPTLNFKDDEGIGIQRLSNSIIRHNEIYRCRYGINLWESGNGVTDGLEIRDNYVYDIRHAAPHWPSRGIFTSGGPDTTGSLINLVIDGNVVDGVEGHGIRTQSPPNPTNLTVSNNLIHNTFGYSVDPGWNFTDNKETSAPMAAKEVCIAARTFNNVEEGDILGVRDPKGGIGLKEGKDFIWVIMDSSDMPSGSLRNESNSSPKYNLPLSKLQEKFPELDLTRLRDEADHYQPLFDTDPSTGLHRKQNLPKAFSRSIADKEL